MSAYGWRKNSPVEEWLYEEPQRFDFYQAVRLLELADIDRAPGVRAERDREAVRFRSAVSLAFPESDVVAVTPRADAAASGENGSAASAQPQKRQQQGDGLAHAAQMTVNFMGLAGALGPLPMPFTEIIIERTRRGDHAAREFLDIFNHRLVSLLYRIRKLHRVGLDIRPPGEDAFAGWLFSIIGLGTPNLDARLQVKDRSLLFYAGLLGQRQRSMAGLERMLSHYFGVGVRGTESVGRWLTLEREQQTVLRSRHAPARRRQSAPGDEQGLGKDAVIGRRVWDQQGAFELNLGPLTLAQFLDFLPTGWAFRPLCDLVRFYVGDDLDFSFRLTLKAGETVETGARAGRLGKAARLGATRLAPGTSGMRLSNSADRGARLGWTSWLASLGRERKDRQVVVSPKPLRAFGVESTMPYFALPPDKLMEVKRLMKVRRYAADEQVIRQGEPGDSLFVIGSGRVKVVRRQEGRDVQLGTLGPGECFGETALLTGKVHHATVTTLEPCELHELSRENLEHMTARYPRFGSYLHDYALMRRRRGKGQ